MIRQVLPLFFTVMLCTPVYSFNEFTGSNEDIWKTVYHVPIIAGKDFGEVFYSERSWPATGSISIFYTNHDADPIKTDAIINVLFDGKNLVFKIVVNGMESGEAIRKCYLSDEPDLRRVPNISITLDPDHNHGMYYRFIVDSKGNKQDLCVDDESWHTEWHANIRIEVDGKKQVIIAIPVERLGKRIVNGDIWGFNVNLNGIAGIGSLSAVPVNRRPADAENFGHLLFSESAKAASLSNVKNHLIQVHHNQKKAKLEVNRAMCGPEPVQLAGEINLVGVGTNWTLNNGSAVTCIGMANEKIIRSSYPFIYEKYENEKLQYLRNLYRLEEIVSDGKNDFEKLLLLNEWLHSHVTFGSPPPIRPDALHVLSYGLTGQPFNCTYLSFTLMQMYISLGYTARKITSVGHGTLDVWSDYWEKWIQIDPSRNSYYRLKEAGIPLNSNEIRREYWKNGGIDMEMVYGTEQRAEQVTLEKREKDGLLRYRTDGYQWIAYKSRNNFFEVPFVYWNYDYLIAEDEYNSEIIWKNGNETDQREILGTRTRHINDIFWTLNQAYIRLYKSDGGNLTVQLETVTPNFQTFECSVDEGEWKQTEPVFQWGLHEGQNSLRARSINKFGITGKEHKIILHVN